jgi:hypothetical protein
MITLRFFRAVRFVLLSSLLAFVPLVPACSGSSQAQGVPCAPFVRAACAKLAGTSGSSTNLHGLGRTLVALRIALGLTQRQLAERLSVNESQISRDERNEYQGITVDRASRILDALGVTLRSAFQTPIRVEAR